MACTESSLLATKSATGLMEWPDVSTALGSLMLMNHAVVRNEGRQLYSCKKFHTLEQT